MSEMKWHEVAAVHGAVAGIGVQDGVATSLLFNQQKDGRYADRLDEDVLRYFVSAETQAFRVAALRQAGRDKSRLRVFEKMGTNKWKDHGHWVVDKAEDLDGGVTMFVLLRAP